MKIIDRVLLAALRWRLDRGWRPELADEVCELLTRYSEAELRAKQQAETRREFWAGEQAREFESQDSI